MIQSIGPVPVVQPAAAQQTSTSKRRRGARPTPKAGFPLFAHANGQWARKIKGHLYYFGPWADQDAALTRYLNEKDDRAAGRKPRKESDGLTVEDLCNRFLTSKLHQMDTEELSPRTFADYHATCKLILYNFGSNRAVTDLRPEDFEALKVKLPKTWGPVRRGKTIQMVRSVFKYATDEALVDKVIRVGKQFKRPSKKVLRKQRAKNGKRMLEAAELRKVLDAAPQPLKAMILLGANCGFGNTDVASLPEEALDLERGWVNFPRPKTGVPRRCWLWPETFAAVKEALAQRPAAKDQAHAGLVFVTRCGVPWVRVKTTPQEDGTITVKCDDAVSKEMTKILKAQKLHKGTGVSFYSLRHITETIGGESRDQVAVDAVMGHVDPSMAGQYREGISDERLRAVAEHVRTWLYHGHEGPLPRECC